jgi:cysteine desulfurase
MQRIYLDNNATTSLDLQVFKAMVQELRAPPSNPSSIHWFGQQAKSRLNQARRTVAECLKTTPEEILFTSGGTEGINYLLRGLKPKGHIITTKIEHSAVYKTVLDLEGKGLAVSYIPVGLWGAPTPEQVEAEIRPDTIAIILSASNGETGVKLDLEGVAAVAEKRNIPLFIDAVAYIGKEPLFIPKAVTGLAISAHKFHGPKGIGAVMVRPHLKLSPSLTGGNQETSKRAGTENLAGILGLAEAMLILKERQDSITQTLFDLRKHFEQGIFSHIPDVIVHGEGPRISNTSNLAFLGVDGETLLMQLDLAGIAVSHGSACSAGAIEPSRILSHMGIDRKTARSSIRFSFSRMNTREEIDTALERIIEIVRKLRRV